MKDPSVIWNRQSMRCWRFLIMNWDLRHWSRYLQQLLLFATAVAISIGGIVLSYLPLGFNDLMEGYFRTLCVGYGIYAVANTMLLILLYFTDYQGGLVASALFALVSSAATVISLFFSKVYLALDLFWDVQFFPGSLYQIRTIHQEASILYSQQTAFSGGG